jgi:NADH dehydrogenase
MRRLHRVVIIGAGFGGLAAARALRDEQVDVVLIDANNFHTFTPLLYQVATAGLAADDIAYPVRGVLRRQRNVSLRMAVVTSVDLEHREVHTAVGPPVPYDSLIVSAGAISHTFGVPGVAEHAIDLKSLDDAIDLRNHVLERFEATSAGASSIEDGALNVVICGGGPTGVELAGAFMELYAHVMAKDFPRLDVARARIVIVEAADRLLGGFAPKSSDRARAALSRRGVEVVTGVPVSEIEAESVRLADGRVIRAHTIVWAAGVRGSPLAETLGVPTLPNGRLVVGDDLAIPGHPEVFAIGDIGANPAAPLPQVALPAIQGGKHAARQIGRRLAGQPTEAFVYRDLGSMATIGRQEAIAELPGGVRLAGRLGWIAWLGLHVIRLMGFRNRVNVLVNWVWNYLTYDRAARLLSERATTGVVGVPSEEHP